MSLYLFALLIGIVAGLRAMTAPAAVAWAARLGWLPLAGLPLAWLGGTVAVAIFTVLAALEETENALSSYVNEHEHQKTLILATEAAARASELAQQQYESGLVDFQTVLTTQRSYLLLQDDLNQSNGEIVANTIRLYKALGGGWQAGTAAANTGASAP